MINHRHYLGASGEERKGKSSSKQESSCVPPPMMMIMMIVRDDDGIQWFWSEVKITFKLRKKK
jgi:hypothetical protein